MIIAGTGHRPPKLGGYCNRNKVEEFAVAWMDHAWQTKQIPSSAQFISGGALGWDQALAVAARTLAFEYHLYLPFRDFEVKWPAESQDYLDNLRAFAKSVKYISEPGYASYKMQLRNEAMVTDSHVLVALYDGSPGGTRNCINYARSWRGGYKQPVNLWQAWQQFQKGEFVEWPILQNTN